ncbi:lipid biosynthesis B12-binding/radical SAM protein [Desulforhopalus sp. 52FAK]
MRILLVSPNTLTVPYPVYPLGLDYVATSISSDHEVEIADLNTLTLTDLAEIVTTFSPNIIGLSCRNVDNMDPGDFHCFLEDYAKIVSHLRSHSKATIVCGGSAFTIMPERIFPILGADYGVIGEGERFGLLIEAINEGRDPAELPGVITSTNIDKNAPPPWEGPIKRDFQSLSHNSFYLTKGGMLNLQSKRGCCFNCIYCSYPHIEGHKHRLVDPKDVAKTALELQAAGAKYFFITDSAFNSDIKHSLEVAKAFKTAGVSIPWGSFFAPMKHPENYFQTLADAGLSHVEFGTESLSASVLKTYRKPFSVGDVFTAHEQALDAGLHVAHYFLLGGPGESAATITESLDNIDALKKAVFFFFIGIRIYPETALYDIAMAEGKITPDTNFLEPIFYTADDIEQQTIEAMVESRAGKRSNWIFGAGNPEETKTVSAMYERGYTGPLWEYLIR